MRVKSQTAGAAEERYIQTSMRGTAAEEIYIQTEVQLQKKGATIQA